MSQKTQYQIEKEAAEVKAIAERHRLNAIEIQERLERDHSNTLGMTDMGLNNAPGLSHEHANEFADFQSRQQDDRKEADLADKAFDEKQMDTLNVDLQEGEFDKKAADIKAADEKKEIDDKKSAELDKSEKNKPTFDAAQADKYEAIAKMKDRAAAYDAARQLPKQALNQDNSATTLPNDRVSDRAADRTAGSAEPTAAEKASFIERIKAKAAELKATELKAIEAKATEAKAAEATKVVPKPAVEVPKPAADRTAASAELTAAEKASFIERIKAKAAELKAAEAKATEATKVAPKPAVEVPKPAQSQVSTSGEPTQAQKDALITKLHEARAKAAEAGPDAKTPGQERFAAKCHGDRAQAADNNLTTHGTPAAQNRMANSNAHATGLSAKLDQKIEQRQALEKSRTQTQEQVRKDETKLGT